MTELPRQSNVDWWLWAWTSRHIVHVIRERGYDVCVALIGAALTVRVFPLLHGPPTRDGAIGWDPIDRIPLPRWAP